MLDMEHSCAPTVLCMFYILAYFDVIHEDISGDGTSVAQYSVSKSAIIETYCDITRTGDATKDLELSLFR